MPVHELRAISELETAIATWLRAAPSAPGTIRQPKNEQGLAAGAKTAPDPQRTRTAPASRTCWRGDQ
jgi:hypothetical protein